MTKSLGVGRVLQGLDLNNLCEICGTSRNKGKHISCAKKRAAKYRKEAANG